MKLKPVVSKILTNKWVLNFVSLLALLNLIGYIVIGNVTNVVLFVIIAIVVRYFSKNMIIVLGAPLLLVNLFSLKNIYSIEGLENNKTSDHDEIIKKINDQPKKNEHPVLPGTEHTEDLEGDNVDPANVKTDEHFEVGRTKNGGSKIDYAATIENAYDELNKVLGSDGIKSLTDDTQRLMKQQMELAKSMEGLAPLVEKMMPMAEKMQGMMQNMDSGNSGMSGIMEMAQKMAKGLGNANKST